LEQLCQSIEWVLRRKNKTAEPGMKAHCEVFGEALDTAPFARILTVKPLWIKLVAQAQRFVFLV
jgi:hypothetical protein